jgi:hypothetical protein
LEKIIHIDTVALRTAPHGEDVRKGSSPSHIGVLVEVDEDNLTKIKDTPAEIFLNIVICLTRSNTLIMSIRQVNTSDPFLSK